MKPFVNSPLGKSELGSHGNGYWNNRHIAVSGPVTCEICGTNHPEDDDCSYMLSEFFGRQVVEDCCGAIFDLAYQELKEEFTLAFLEEFTRNPADSRFGNLLYALNRLLPKASQKLAEVKGQVDEALGHLGHA